MPKPPDNNSRAVAVRPQARLKKPAYLNDPNDAAYIDDASWQVLTDTTFPTAKDPNVVALAISLCRIRKLDIFRKPYHVVPMWNSLLGREVEQLMPGINELLVTATRTGGFAGNDPPVYGNAITETFKGQRKDRQGNWIDAEVTLTYPETISITVYRNVENKREAFTMPIRWREEYQRVGRTELPNEMWSRRTYDQGQKVALAASLRVAFPDVVEPEAIDTSINVHGDAQIIDNDAQQLPVGAGGSATSQEVEQEHLSLVEDEPPHNPETGEIFVEDPPPADDRPYLIPFIENQDDPREAFMTWARAFAAKVSPLKNEKDLDGWIVANRPMIDILKERASGIHGTLTTGINKCRVRIANETARQARG